MIDFGSSSSPEFVFSGITQENRGVATDFARERTVRRYNTQLNELISFWTVLLAAGGSEIRTFNVSAGVGAVFCLGTTTAYSKRARG